MRDAGARATLAATAGPTGGLAPPGFFEAALAPRAEAGLATGAVLLAVECLVVADGRALLGLAALLAARGAVAGLGPALAGLGAALAGLEVALWFEGG